MTTKKIKARRVTRAGPATQEPSIALTTLDNGSEVDGAQDGGARPGVFDHRYLGYAQGLGRLANEQARLHPLATFGIVFAAGLVAVAASRRLWPWANR